MDTGLGPALEDVIARHGAHVQITQEPVTGVWVAIERPTPTQQLIWTGTSLEQLAAKLDEDFPASDGERPAVDVVACAGVRGAVDIIGDRRPGDVIHVTPGEWAEFLAAVKAGRYDDVAGD